MLDTVINLINFMAESLVPVGNVVLPGDDNNRKVIGKRASMASTWAKIKSLKETKVQLETDNEKIN